MDFTRIAISNSGLITEYIITLILIVVFLILPGWLALNIFTRKTKRQYFFSEYIALSILISFVIFAPLAFLGYLVYAPLLYLLISELIVIASLFVMNFYFKAWRKIEFNIADWVIIIISIIVLILTLFPYTPLHGDASYHFGYFRRIAESGILSPHYSIYKVDNYTDPVYGYNLYYAFTALICRFGLVDAQHLWFILLSYIPALSVISFGYLARSLLPLKKFIILAVLMFAFEEIITHKLLVFRLSAAPGEITRLIFVPIFLGMIVQWWRTRERWILIILCLFFPCLIGLHGFDLLYATIGVLVLLPIFFIKNSDISDKTHKIWIEIGIAVAGVIAISVPLLWGKLHQAKYITDQFVTTVPKKPDLINLGNNTYMVNMYYWITPYFIGGLVAAIILIFLAIKYKKVIVNQKNLPFWVFSFGMLIVPSLIMHVPYIATISMKYVSYIYVHRLTGLIPFALLFAGAIYFLIEVYKKQQKVIIITSILCILILDIVVYHQKFPFGKRNYEFRSPQTRALESLGRPSYSEALAQYADSNSVVLSDNLTSHYLRGISTYNVVMVMTPHIPGIWDDHDRSRFTAAMLNPESNFAKTMKYLRVYKVDIVLIKKQIKGVPNNSYDKYKLLAEEYPNYFKEVFSDNEYAIFQVNRSGNNEENK